MMWEQVENVAWFIENFRFTIIVVGCLIMLVVLSPSLFTRRRK